MVAIAIGCDGWIRNEELWSEGDRIAVMTWTRVDAPCQLWLSCCFRIKELVEDFLYPASRLMASFNRTGELLSAVADPICTTSASVVAALDLLVALSAGCVPNTKLLTTMLTDMFFSGTWLNLMLPVALVWCSLISIHSIALAYLLMFDYYDRLFSGT